ncbi:MAG: universal stress protein [Gemmatimonadetes bacterium]|nr:universal stress protein [Gemmatimonadota bacterium]
MVASMPGGDTPGMLVFSPAVRSSITSGSPVTRNAGYTVLRRNPDALHEETDSSRQHHFSSPTAGDALPKYIPDMICSGIAGQLGRVAADPFHLEHLDPEVPMSTSIDRIVVGVATVTHRDPLILPAIEMAEAIGATVHFIYAFDLPDPLLQAYARDGYLGDHFGEQYGENLRTQLELQVREISESDSIRCHAAMGSASEVLCDSADELEADLLVVGATRSGSFFHSLLGSTAERVVRGSHLPVLVLRAPLRRPIAHVLLTGDLSDFSIGVHERGLGLVGELFPGDDPRLCSLLVVWHDLALPAPMQHDDMRELAESELTHFLASHFSDERQVEGRVRVGNPATEITAEARTWPADLLVLGTHGRTGSSRFLLGSVAEKAIRGSQANVLVIPSVRTPDAKGESGNSASTITATA